MKISKYSIISIPVVYIVLCYTVFAVKYAVPVDTPLNQAFIDKLVSSIAHLWHLKLAIALAIAIMVNIISYNRKLS